MNVALHPAWVTRTADMAMDTETSDDIRLAAMIALAEVEASRPDAHTAMQSITDPVGTYLRWEARQAAWGNHGSDLTPRTRAVRERLKAQQKASRSRLLYIAVAVTIAWMAGVQIGAWTLETALALSDTVEVAQ